MKKYILASLIAASFWTSGCDSFLDDQPRGNAIAETTDQYDGLFNTTDFMNLDMMDYTHWFNDQILIDEECANNLTSTLFYIKGPEAVERAWRYQKDIYEPTENCPAWAGCYKNIYTFNVIVDGVMNSSGGTMNEKKTLLAEARVSRAWMHFILAQMFSKPYNANTGNELTIPIVKEADTDVSAFERATMKEFYDFVVTEMEESCPDLEDRKDHNMRVYKTTGYALLGKMYWMMGEYEKALEPLRTAYSRLKNETDFYLRDFNALSTQYGYTELMPLFLMMEQQATPDCLLPYIYADPEVLWVKQNAYSLSSLYFALMNVVTYYLTEEAYALFDENDLRRNLIPTRDDRFTPYPHPVGGIRDGSTNYGVDMPEVYLALAECEARVGDENKAKELLEEFRAHRVRTGHEGIPTTVQTKEDLIKFCIDEQSREFMGNNNRYYNLRRLWNDPVFQDQKPIVHRDGSNTYTMQEDNLYLQLPESVLKWNSDWR